MEALELRAIGHQAFSSWEVQNHPSTISLKSCPLARGQPSITARSNLHLKYVSHLLVLKPLFTQKWGRHEPCVYNVGDILLLQPNPSQEFQNCLIGATRWQLGQMVSAFVFIFSPNQGILRFTGEEAELGNENLVESWDCEPCTLYFAQTILHTFLMATSGKHILQTDEDRQTQAIKDVPPCGNSGTCHEVSEAGGFH